MKNMVYKIPPGREGGAKPLVAHSLKWGHFNNQLPLQNLLANRALLGFIENSWQLQPTQFRSPQDGLYDITFVSHFIPTCRNIHPTSFFSWKLLIYHDFEFKYDILEPYTRIAWNSSTPKFETIPYFSLFGSKPLFSKAPDVA